MAIELRIIFQGTKEAEGIALNQVGVREIGPMIFIEVAPMDADIRQAELGLAQARANQFAQLMRPAPNGQIIKPGFLKPPKGKKPKKGK